MDFDHQFSRAILLNISFRIFISQGVIILFGDVFAVVFKKIGETF